MVSLKADYPRTIGITDKTEASLYDGLPRPSTLRHPSTALEGHRTNQDCLMILRSFLLLLGVAIAGCATNRPQPVSTAFQPVSAVTEIEREHQGTEPAVRTVSHEVTVPTELTVEQLQELALAHNPSIRQVAAAKDRATGAREQSGLLPNPQLGYFSEEVGNEGSGGLHGIFASQTIVTGGKLELGEHVLDHEVARLEHEMKVQRLRVLTDIRLRFIDALAAQQRIEIAKSFLVQAEKGLTVAKDRLQTGGTRPDVLQSEIQVSEIKLLIQRAEFDFRSSWQSLVAAAGAPDLDARQLKGNLSKPAKTKKLEPLLQQLLANSPQVDAAKERANRAKANFDRQEVQAQPNINGQVGVGTDTASGDQFVSLQVSLPLPINNANQGNIRAARAAIVEADHNVKRLQLHLRQRLARVLADCNQAQATVDQYEKVILPKVKLSQRLISEAHKARVFDFLRVLTARRMRFDADLQYIEAKRQLGRSQALIDGVLLSGGLTDVGSFSGGFGLRGQALNGQ